MKPAIETINNHNETPIANSVYSREDPCGLPSCGLPSEVGGLPSPSDRSTKRGYGVLVLEDGTRFTGSSFGYEGAVDGELVFCTGMVGYPEALTDASFAGQILTMTYPIMGNYGVPESSLWEDDRIHVAGLIVSNYIDTPSHADSVMTLSTWLKREHVPALEIKDTRALTQHIRKHGVMLGKIIFNNDIPFHDPNQENLVARVSTRKVQWHNAGTRFIASESAPTNDITIALIDCGAKRNIVRSLIAKGVRVVTVPWDFDLFAQGNEIHFDGILVSNGPGNPKMAVATIETLRRAMQHGVPTMGICLGHQLLALAAGGDTYKLKFGHRSQNQPSLLSGTRRCYITTQNHGFAVGRLPQDFEPWFINANDGSNEGMRHKSQPFFSVQFHPEAAPGPMDTDWIFTHFLDVVRERKGTPRG